MVHDKKIKFVKVPNEAHLTIFQQNVLDATYSAICQRFLIS